MVMIISFIVVDTDKLMITVHAMYNMPRDTCILLSFKIIVSTNRYNHICRLELNNVKCNCKQTEFKPVTFVGLC